jgi:hypothetical protein
VNSGLNAENLVRGKLLKSSSWLLSLFLLASTFTGFLGYSPDSEAGWKTNAAAAACALKKDCRKAVKNTADKVVVKCKEANCVERTKTLAIKGARWLKGYRDPLKIRYSQNNIKSKFSNGSTIKELTNGLKSGKIKPEDIPPIRLIKKDGKWFSIDNRRLKAFKDAGVNVRTRKATKNEIADAIKKKKFSTTNDGSSIRVRGE